MPSTGIVVVQSLSHVQLWDPHRLQHARLSCPLLSPGACSNSCLFSQWWHPTFSSSVAPFSFCPQSFPATGSQSFGASASASILPMNSQGWFPSGLISFRIDSLISLLFNGLSRVFPSTTISNCQFFGAQPSLWFSSYNHTWPLGRP